MKKKYVLYNELSGNGKGKIKADELNGKIKDSNLIYKDILKIKDYNEFFKSIEADSDIIICGGDGTLNHFINDTNEIKYSNDIFFYSAGTGNDFLNDIEQTNDEMPVKITEYIKDLPTVKIKGKVYNFLNGIGYGIDGYCCEEGDKLRKKSNKPINYTAIAIKGLLFNFKPRNAVINIDGKEFKYKKVWLAPTMNGRYYGGGMMIAPKQSRLDTNKNVSIVVLYGKGKLKTLVAFPTIFSGEHINKHPEMVAIKTGHNIKVKFDKPTALQIDGETILDVEEYEVMVKSYAKL